MNIIVEVIKSAPQAIFCGIYADEAIGIESIGVECPGRESWGVGRGDMCRRSYRSKNYRGRVPQRGVLGSRPWGYVQARL